ncbi:hypothetical protein Nepgr_013936 [Nepenthes gracilis]|uniref:DUF7865 domain-containing protein n=1 Tax=Nepenthes gracilis TaxID=150966 RepID=A0AAD3SIB4_NEPGR|nr:hypothetical protein Nepgr_013936 [Nepenthes gracilis]
MPKPASCSLVVYVLHSMVAPACVLLTMFCENEISVFIHGIETARKQVGSTWHDQLLIQVSDFFAELLHVAIGSLLLVVAFVNDREFQGFFANGCIVLHVSMAL